MVVKFLFDEIVQSSHYKEYHKKKVPFSVVLKIVFSIKPKIYKNRIVKFESKSYYVLGKLEHNKLKIINAKKK